MIHHIGMEVSFFPPSNHIKEATIKMIEKLRTENGEAKINSHYKALCICGHLKSWHNYRSKKNNKTKCNHIGCPCVDYEAEKSQIERKEHEKTNE